MKKSYADICLERVEKAKNGRDYALAEEMGIHDVPELARRLNKAIDGLHIAANFISEVQRDNDDELTKTWFRDLAEELEALLVDQ